MKSKFIMIVSVLVIAILGLQVINLNNKYNSLQRDHQIVVNDYNVLQNDYTSLIEEYNDLATEIPMHPECK